MNINGHEIERRDGLGGGRVYIDGEDTDYRGNRDPDYYTRSAEQTRAEIAHLTKEAAHADLIAEFVRREAAEKAEQDAADELDRRADLARLAWFGPRGKNNALPWHLVAGDAQEDWRNLVRALDADTATRQPDQAGEPS